jgi:hypothetical protein
MIINKKLKMHISNLNLLKLLEIICYFVKPAFFTNLTFIVTMILVYLKQVNVLPYLLTLNLFILIIGSFISIFFIRSAIKVAMSRLNITGVNIPKFSIIHFVMILVGIMIHVIMTIILKIYIYKQFTVDEIYKAERYGDKNRMKIAKICIGIVLLYFMTGLYTIYGMNTIGIITLFIIGPPIMYLCTYLNDYYFYKGNYERDPNMFSFS